MDKAPTAVDIVWEVTKCVLKEATCSSVDGANAETSRRGATKPSDGTPEQALAAALAVPGMTSVLVTTTSPAHLAASLAVAGLDGGAARA